MKWDDTTRERLEVALNEADVLGIRVDGGQRVADVLLHVLALPEYGPIDHDARRILRLLNVGDLSFVLRPDSLSTEGLGEPLPLADLEAVESFFESLSWGGSMYGWRFFDDPKLIADWPKSLSLEVSLRAEAAQHTFFWFNECGWERAGEHRSFCIEGTISFDDLVALRADGTEEPTEQFIEEGERWWRALHARDPRLAPEAQRDAQRGAPKWRTWANGGTIVTGTLGSN